MRLHKDALRLLSTAVLAALVVPWAFRMYCIHDKGWPCSRIVLFVLLWAYVLAGGASALIQLITKKKRGKKHTPKTLTLIHQSIILGGLTIGIFIAILVILKKNIPCPLKVWVPALTFVAIHVSTTFALLLNKDMKIVVNADYLRQVSIWYIVELSLFVFLLGI